MSSSSIMLLLVAAWFVAKSDAAPQDLGSPIRIAQCRAICLNKFVRNDRHETLCQQDPDCFTCWENCGLLQDNPTVWSRICSQPSVCFPGCQQACQFFTQNADVPQKDPVMPTSAEPCVKLVGNLASWPRPSDRSSAGSIKREKERLVYAVIQKQNSGRWRQIIQTAEERCFLPSGETPSSAAGNLRVLAIGGRGLVALYRPEYEDSSNENSIASDTMPDSDMVVETHASVNQPIDEFAEVPDITSESDAISQNWKLREVSLIHQKVLVIAEVAWPVQRTSDGQATDYLVTWEVDGGGLKGHLYTDATSVTLSLWPDTVYHIQVDLVTSDAIQLRSVPLTIDTHKASAVQSEESRPLPAAPLVDRLSGTKEHGRRLEATVGVGAAAGISLFLLVLATAIGVRRHRQASMRLTESPSPLPRHYPRTIESLSNIKTIDVDHVPYRLPPPCAVHSLEHCLYAARSTTQKH